MKRKALFLYIAIALCKAVNASQIVNPPTSALAILPLPAGDTSYINVSTSAAQQSNNAAFNVSSGTALTLNNQNINGTFIGFGRNRVINGDMQFDQYNESTDANQNVYTSTNAAHYTLDQWRIENTNATSHYTVLRTTTTVPNNFFQNALQVKVTTSAATSSGDGVNIEYPAESWYMRDFAWGTANAQPATLQFWVMSSSAGVYSVTVLQDNASARSYLMTYTLAANTWTHEVFTIPGDTTPPATNWPTSGNANFSFKIVWDLGSGSSVSTPSTFTWLGSTFWKVTGSNSITAAPSGTKWYLTGVQFELGTQATSFEYLPPDVELARLERYFWKSLYQGFPCASGQGLQGSLIYVSPQPGLTSGGGVQVWFPTTMSGENDLTNFGGLTTWSPIVGGGNTSWFNQTQGTVSGVPDLSYIGETTSGLFIRNPQVAADSAGDVMGLHICVSEQLGGP